MNLSPRFYMDESMVSEIKRIMKEYKVMSSQIWFELTEFADVEDKETLKRLITKLTATGFRFALDDFGKGQSNLIRLFDYPFHCIKLDKELTWKLDQGQESYAASKKPITSISLSIDAEIMPGTDIGSEDIEIESRNEKYSIDGYTVSNSGSIWEADMVPEIRMRLCAGNGIVCRARIRKTMRIPAVMMNKKRSFAD